MHLSISTLLATFPAALIAANALVVPGASSIVPHHELSVLMEAPISSMMPTHVSSRTHQQNRTERETYHHHHHIHMDCRAPHPIVTPMKTFTTRGEEVSPMPTTLLTMTSNGVSHLNTETDTTSHFVETVTTSDGY
ncbi:hypothetical protein G7Y89_g11213 [Cudoniella acicularis]|uniref:Uncharacterized protein n=1 Tax=Cudoniella acicularis TaxID=354080 RepID=A0A8H4RBA4_9HELO|nr:hypothetical protein G7Y89_g11213 [Cudoniella acicularis]